MAANTNLHKAKEAKNDEFYTQLTDVAKEMMHYKQHFKDKIVLCNCDDPTWSAFWKYFHLNFEALGLKMMEHGKKFLIIGNMNAITYKEIFPLIRDDRLWLGVSLSGSKCSFIVPDSYEGKNTYYENGHKMAKINNAIWFTNLDHTKRHEKIILWKKYTPEEYPHYDNYDAINVDRYGEIPLDWNGVMGVPITYLYRHNPEQFEIIELGNSRDNFTPNKDYINPKKHLKDGKITNGGAINCVLAIEQDIKPTGMVYYTSDNSKYLVPPYARILIRRKVGA